MKIACVKDGKIEIKEAPKPSIEGFGAIIKILGCGLCGSDIVKFKQNSVKEGTVLGHEIVGEIVEINSNTDFKVGDKIVSSHHVPCLECKYCKNGNYSMCKHFKETNIIPGGFSEYIYLSEEHLQNVAVRIPEGLTEEEASFYEPLGCCIRAVKRAGEIKGKKVLVIGLGSIGILMGQGVNAFGGEAYGCDLIPERIQKANNLGIKAFNSKDIKDIEADIVFMTAGADVTIDLALRAVRDGGKIIVFASTPKNSGYANNEIYYRELTVIGSYSPSPEDLQESIRLLSSKKVIVEGLSTVYEFSDIEKAFQDTINNTILKVYINLSSVYRK